MTTTSANRQSLYARLRRNFRAEFIEALVAAAVVAALLRIFVVSVYRVPTESMMPTLIPGDFIVAWKTSYGVPIPFTDDRIGARDPRRNDVVIFRRPDEDTLFVKRVVGVPGDRVEIRDGRLSVNEVVVTDAAADESEIYTETIDGSTHRVMRRANASEADFLAPLVVPPGHIFLLGDYRSESFDSRQWGSVSITQIVGRASFIGMSVRLDATSTVDRSGRLFKAIQ